MPRATPSHLESVSVYQLKRNGRALVRVDIDGACPMCRGRRTVTFRGKAHPYTIPCPSCGGAA